MTSPVSLANLGVDQKARENEKKAAYAAALKQQMLENEEKKKKQVRPFGLGCVGLLLLLISACYVFGNLKERESGKRCRDTRGGDLANTSDVLARGSMSPSYPTNLPLHASPGMLSLAHRAS